MDCWDIVKGWQSEMSTWCYQTHTGTRASLQIITRSEIEANPEIEIDLLEVRFSGCIVSHSKMIFV